MKKLPTLACTAAILLLAASVLEVTVDESGITTNNRGGRRLALRDHVLRRLRRRLAPDAPEDASAGAIALFEQERKEALDHRRARREQERAHASPPPPESKFERLQKLVDEYNADATRADRAAKKPPPPDGCIPDDPQYVTFVGTPSDPLQASLYTDAVCCSADRERECSGEMGCNYIANTCTGEMQCKCITSEQAAAAICNQYVYPDESDYCNYERECVWDDDNYACVRKVHSAVAKITDQTCQEYFAYE